MIAVTDKATMPFFDPFFICSPPKYLFHFTLDEHWRITPTQTRIIYRNRLPVSGNLGYELRLPQPLSYDHFSSSNVRETVFWSYILIVDYNCSSFVSPSRGKWIDMKYFRRNCGVGTRTQRSRELEFAVLFVTKWNASRWFFFAVISLWFHQQKYFSILEILNHVAK